MRILVYGAGAVGGFFGGLLARAGEDVRFVARGTQLESLRTTGLTIDSTLLGTIRLPAVPAASSAREAGPADLILVCVKTHQLPAILDDLASAVESGTVIVPLQNGVEADEVLSVRFPENAVLPAVVYVGATVEAPGVVRHVAAGTIGLGAIRSEDEAVLAGIRTRRRKGLPLHTAGVLKDEKRLYYQGTKRFGSWDAALRAAGIAPEGVRKHRTWTRQEVIAAVRSRAKAGKSMRYKEAVADDSRLVQAAQRAFPTSWARALVAAGAHVLCVSTRPPDRPNRVKTGLKSPRNGERPLPSSGALPHSVRNGAAF